MFERMTVNIGPTHPAMHGTFRLMAVLDGETIVASDIEIGYLHRCFEKMSETHNWQQIIPYTDRLNYCSSFINNVAYCKTVENLLGIEAPPKAVWARTILSEFSRIMDHCVCNGTTLVDAGGLTNFWYLFQPREEIYGLLESVCGARPDGVGLPHRRPDPGLAAGLRGPLPAAAGDHSAVRQGLRDAGQQEPHLDRSLGGHRRHLRRGRGELGLDGTLPAGERRRLRRPPGASLRSL